MSNIALFLSADILKVSLRQKMWQKEMKMLLVWLIVMLLQIVVDSSAFEPLQVVVEVNGFKIPAIVDTGAEISVMSTSCAERCCLTNSIDIQHAGKAIGVGTSEIVGGIDALGLRIGPLSFQNKVSILRSAHQRYDFILGLDILKRFNCDILLRQKILKMNVKGNEIRVPMLSFDTKLNNPFDDEIPSSSSQDEVLTKEDIIDLPKMKSAKGNSRSKGFVQPRGGYYSQHPVKRESIFDNFDDDSQEDEDDFRQQQNTSSYSYDDNDENEDDPDYLYNGNSVSMEGV